MKPFSENQVAIIGAGNIGRMLIDRLSVLGMPADHIAVCDLDPQKAQSAVSSSGVRIFDLSDSSSCQAEIWLLCSGPKTILPILKNLSSHLKAGHILVSFAAAVPLEMLEALVLEGVNVARIMPNMPSLVGRGINPVCFSAKCTPEARAAVQELLDVLGRSIEVRDDQMNWAVGLTGAAMRSVLPVIEGMMRAGQEAGLPEAEARLIATQILAGTAELVMQTPLNLTEIKGLTPMETLDEADLADMIYNAALNAKKKVDNLQANVQQESS